MTAAVFVSACALAFTVGSFWWVHARRGHLEVAAPRTYAFFVTSHVRLRFPFAFYNTGARAFVVGDLRVVFADEPSRPPLRWIRTHQRLRPDNEDGHTFATPFAVPGRNTRETIMEFGQDPTTWFPDPLSKHKLRLEAQLHNDNRWKELVTFAWWAPHSKEIMGAYITHRNEFVGGPADSPSGRALSPEEVEDGSR
jgi:hypothetical protein